MTLQNFTLGTFSQGAAGGGGAFESIASASGTGSSGTVTFTSIPGTYQHLQLRIFGFCFTSGAGEPTIRFNGDTGTNYTRHGLASYNNGVNVQGVASATYIEVGNTTNPNASLTTTYPALAIVDIHDYASTTKNKTVKALGGISDPTNAANSEMALRSGIWRSTSAITSISVIAPTTNWSSDSRFALYGIKGA